jgi:hypothetical protein
VDTTRIKLSSFSSAVISPLTIASCELSEFAIVPRFSVEIATIAVDNVLPVMHKLVRTLDANDNKLGDHLLELDGSETFEDIYDTLKLNRPLIAVHLLQLATMPASEAIEVSSQHLTVNSALEVCQNVGLPECNAILLILGSVDAPVQPAARSSEHNAFSLMMSSSHQIYSRARDHFMTQVMIGEEFAEESSKGQLARKLGNHLMAKGAGFLRTDAKSHRLSLFQALHHIFWCVTPKLKKSLNSDLSKVSGDVKIGFRDIEHLLGAERTKEPQQDSADAQLRTALSAVFQGKDFFSSAPCYPGCM